MWSDCSGRGWRKHTEQEHNIWSYVYFLLMIEKKEKSKCTGLEKFVKEQIEKKEIDFFPSGDALALKD